MKRENIKKSGREEGKHKERKKESGREGGKKKSKKRRLNDKVTQNREINK